ncbi:MAG TPA: DUF4326 domain-containing protein [Candidatus Nitrosopolaris sp.]
MVIPYETGYNNLPSNINDEEERHYNDGTGNDKGKKQQQQTKSEKKKEKFELPTYKYSKMGKGDLYESIILGGVPAFVSYDERNGKLNPVSNIEEATRILVPPSPEEYPYMPYEFGSEKELDDYVKLAKEKSIDLLYKQALSFVKTYNDQDEYKQILIATDLVWSYFQDKFSTTHYEGVTGDVGSGKSTVGGLFEAIGYRCVNTTNPSAPNVFRMLGMVEPGQCTLILDESDMIDEDPMMMSILKTGYDLLKRVPKTNLNSWKQEYFFTYCLKIIIAERSLNQLKARGVNDRILAYTAYVGDPEGDIKEVMTPQGDPYRQRELDRLIQFRKLMLVYRLVHFNDAITDIDIGVKGRNKELCKPYIKLFYNTNVQKEVEQTLQKFLDIKNNRKSTSLEYALLPIITELINKERTNIILVSRVWQNITATLDGQSAYDKPDEEYHSTDHGTLYRKTITKIICDKFGAEPKREAHTGKRQLVFNLDKLRKIQKFYDTEIKIKTSLRFKPGDNGDNGDNTTGTPTTSREENKTDIFQNLQERQLNIEETLANKPLDGHKEGYGSLLALSPMSPMSPSMSQGFPYPFPQTTTKGFKMLDSSNARVLKYDKSMDLENDNNLVYIGRGSNRLSLKPSKWGNEYIEGSDGTREEVISKHKVWLWNDPKGKEVFRDVFAELPSKNLVCHCAPNPCHGDILLRLANSKYVCYYCMDCQTDSEHEYHSHKVRKHPDKPAYPTKADLEKFGLTPQGKSWEIDIA